MILNLFKSAACSLVFVHCCKVSQTGADIVTLRFEATIESIGDQWTPPGIAPESPFSFVLGETLNGSITFDPSVSTGSPWGWEQPYSLQIGAGGINFATESFTAQVMNDRSTSITVICDCGYTGPISPDPTVYASYSNYYLDTPSPFADPPSEDRIDITRYIGAGASEEASVPGHPEWKWQPLLTVTGGLDVIQDRYLPADAATWNAFDAKSIALGLTTLAYYDNGEVLHAYRKTIVVSGRISDFSIVPEPASRAIASFGVIVMYVAYRCQSRTARTRENSLLT